MPDSIVVVANIKVRKDVEEKVKKEIGLIIEQTRKEKGCLRYDVFQSSNDPTHLISYEKWQNRQALDEHLKKIYIVNLLAKTKEYFKQPIELTLYKEIDAPHNLR